MTTNLPVQAVLFDYGMVLSAPPDANQWQRMLQISGLSPETFEHGYWAFRHAYDRGELTGVQYWHKVAESGDVHFNHDQVTGLIDADTELWTLPNTPMIEWAQHLQAQGLRTGILSNIGDEMTARLSPSATESKNAVSTAKSAPHQT